MMKFLLAVTVIATVLAIGSAQRCPEDYNLNSAAGVCMKYYPARVYFAEAEGTCKADNAVLPSIHSAATEKYVLDRLGRLEITGLWLGLQRDDDGNWAWSDNTPFDYEDWVTGYPSNGADETCAIIGGDGSVLARGWRSSSCDGWLKFGFICGAEPIAP